MKRARRGLKLKKFNREIQEPNQIDSAKLQKLKKLVSAELNYTKVKYKGEIYSIGDILMIRDVNEGFLIGKLLKVVAQGGNKKYSHWPTVQVQW
jgi:hypothetical protein